MAGGRGRQYLNRNSETVAQSRRAACVRSRELNPELVRVSTGPWRTQRLTPPAISRARRGIPLPAAADGGRLFFLQEQEIIKDSDGYQQRQQ